MSADSKRSSSNSGFLAVLSSNTTICSSTETIFERSIRKAYLLPFWKKQNNKAVWHTKHNKFTNASVDRVPPRLLSELTKSSPFLSGRGSIEGLGCVSHFPYSNPFAAPPLIFAPSLARTEKIANYADSSLAIGARVPEALSEGISLYQLWWRETVIGRMGLVSKETVVPRG